MLVAVQEEPGTQVQQPRRGLAAEELVVPMERQAVLEQPTLAAAVVEQGLLLALALMLAATAAPAL